MNTTAQFTLVQVNNCNDVANTVAVTSTASCNAGATVLDLSDKIASPNSWKSGSGSYPPGCFLQGNSLKVYLFAANTGACSSSRKCVCFTAAQCTNTNGVTPNAQSCLCGADACTSTGMYCKNNKCMKTNAFEIIESGTCGSFTAGRNERQHILEHDLCEAAALDLGVPDNSASRSASSSGVYPPGCVLRGTSLYVYVLGQFLGTCTSTNKCLCYTPSKLSTEYNLVVKGRCTGNQQIKTVGICSAAAEALLREKPQATDDGKTVTGPDYSGASLLTCYQRND